MDRGRYTCVVDSAAGAVGGTGGTTAAAPGGGTGTTATTGWVGVPGAAGGILVTAMRARELGRKSVVVGDRVGLVGDISGSPGSLARIVRIAERSSVLRRTADDDDSTPEGRLERIVVANADQLVIVSALLDPPPRTGFIDRCLVAAYDAGIDPLLCLTKADLAGPEEVLGYYRELGLPYVLCRPDEEPEALRAALRGRVSVLVGHSGVGKSTLVNRLVPDAARAVGAVSSVGKGRHTSSSAVALRLPVPGSAGGIAGTGGRTGPDADTNGGPDNGGSGGGPDGGGPDNGTRRGSGSATGSGSAGGNRPDEPLRGPAPGGDGGSGDAENAGDSEDPGGVEDAGDSEDPGWIIDTPGIRSFGLAHVSSDSLLHGFPDLVSGSVDCQPNCEHVDGEERCALDAWVSTGRADPRRLASYRRLLASRSGDDVHPSSGAR